MNNLYDTWMFELSHAEYIRFLACYSEAHADRCVLMWTERGGALI